MPSPFKCRVCVARESVKYRFVVAGDCKERCDSISTCKDILSLRPWMAERRRAAPTEVRGASLRARHNLPPASASVLENVLGRGSEAPSEITPPLLLAAQFRGPGPRAGKVSMESIDRARSNRAPHMEFKHVLGPGVRAMDCALEPFRRVAKESNDVFVKALANERE